MNRFSSKRMPNVASAWGIVLVGLAGLLTLAALAAFVVVVAVLGTMCVVTKRSSPDMDRSDLLGTYVAEYESGTETLILKADGTFYQEVVLDDPADSSPVTRRGEWDWYDETYVRVPNCMGVGDGFGDIREDFRTASGCIWSPARSLFSGKIYLGDIGTAPLRKVD